MKLITFTRAVAMLPGAGSLAAVHPVMTLVIEGQLSRDKNGLVDVVISAVHTADGLRRQLAAPQTVTIRTSMIAATQELVERLKPGEPDPRD